MCDSFLVADLGADSFLQDTGDAIGVPVDHILLATLQKKADFGFCAGVAKQDAAFAGECGFRFV